MKYFTINEDLQNIDVTFDIFYERQKLLIITYALVIIFLIVISSMSYSNLKLINENSVLNKNKFELNEQIATLQNSCNGLEYNTKNVEKFIEYIPFKNKNFIKSQMRLESNNTLSKVARSHNNLFGMKNASKRFQYGKKGEQYRFYQHWTLSVIDRFEWERSGGNINSYAEDTDYFKKIKK